MAERLGLSTFHFVNRQAVYLVAAMTVFVGVSFLTPRQVRRLALLIFTVSLALVEAMAGTGRATSVAASLGGNEASLSPAHSSQRFQFTWPHKFTVAGNFLCHGLGFLLCPLRRANRRQPHDITRCNPGIGLRPALVDAHFPAADDAVNVGFGHPFEVAQQKIVQSLTRGFLVHGQPFDGRCPSGSLDPYNVIHWQLVVSG